jgi:hypothetical protein
VVLQVDPREGGCQVVGEGLHVRFGAAGNQHGREQETSAQRTSQHNSEPVPFTVPNQHRIPFGPSRHRSSGRCVALWRR